ncbi:hypothetical protein BGW37DRAFT_480711 [Umbelopsis sp. PMI_123]|nr:hypothetical protein BGW37DRAFT_480711 [Umbelopsis sp. PMI_123]
MATTAVLSESALSQHQLPISNLQYYGNNTSDSPTTSVISAGLSSNSVLTSSPLLKSYPAQGPLPNTTMAYTVVESRWTNDQSTHSSSTAGPASAYMPLESKPTANAMLVTHSSPESSHDKDGHATEEDSSESAEWAKECIARLLSDVSSIDFHPSVPQGPVKKEQSAVHRSASTGQMNLLVPERSESSPLDHIIRKPSRRVDRAKSFKRPEIATISEESNGISCNNRTQTKPQEPGRLIRRLSLLAQPLKRSLSLISDRSSNMESMNTSQESEKRSTLQQKHEVRRELPQLTRPNGRPMSMAMPVVASSEIDQPSSIRRARAHRMSSIELMQYLSSNLLNVEQDLHHERLENLQSSSSSYNATIIDDNASSTTNSEVDSPDTVLSGVEFPTSAVGDYNAKLKPKENQGPFNPRPRKRSLKRSISSIDILSLGKSLRRNSMSQEDILRSSTYAGGRKSNAKSVSKREIQSILAWKNTIAQLKSEDSFQPLPPLSYQSEAQYIRTQQIRRFIIQEIYTTEQTYLDHLNIIKTMFMDPFIAAATQTSRPLVNPNDISTIFAYIPNIIEVSNVLAYRFESVAKTWHEQSSLIGAVFNQMENDFEVYIRYAVNFHLSQRCITRAHNNILYRRFIQESLRKKETNRMGLSDYMIIPIQRVTRYSLLLKDLKKHTPPTHRDYANIDSALKTMTGLALAMNDAQKKS